MGPSQPYFAELNSSVFPKYSLPQVQSSSNCAITNHYTNTMPRLRAFAPASGVLRCVGALDGAPCTHAALVDLRAGKWGGGVGTAERGVGTALERLHLDHERPLHATCHRWRAAMPAAPRSWDDGLDGAALCHDLFGVCASAAHGAACVRFRCGPPRDAEGVVLRFVDHAYCHRL